MLHVTTEYESLSDLSCFADILGPGLTPIEYHQGDPMPLSGIRLKDFRITSGHLVAADGLVLEGKPFAQPVPNGTHCLLLAIVDAQGDPRIAFAKLQFSTSPAVRWEMATCINQDAKALGPDELYGYGVDTGTGSLSDSLAFERVAKNFDTISTELDQASDRILNDKNFAFAKIQTEAGTFSIFTAGWGDGCYASYFGFSASGQLVSLVTDFRVAKCEFLKSIPR